MVFLTHDQRRAIRTTLSTLSSIHDKAERQFIRGEEIDPRIKAQLLRLTDTTEVANQLNALSSMTEKVRTDYLEQLQVMGSKDLSAFAEYLNPDEPPAPHHVWLCDRLMDMESNNIMRMTISMPPGHAKAIDINEVVPTPSGYVTINDLRVGDKVATPDGSFATVIRKSEVFHSECMQVTTNDGQSVVCDADHLWTVRLDRKRKVWSTRTTRELFERQNNMGDFRRPMLPEFAPISYSKKYLMVAPYTLGLWLGDGDSDGARITSLPADHPEMRARVESEGYLTSSQKAPESFGILGLRGHLEALGVLGNKHIPEQYLLSDTSDRIALLQGLMDSDGTVTPTGQCSWSNTNRCMIDALSTLLFSLGIKNRITESEAKIGDKSYGPYWRVGFYFKDAFHLKRQRSRAMEFKERTGRYITVAPAPAVPTQCITIDREDGLFLVGRGHMVTHNSTYASRYFPAWYLGKHPKKKYIQAGHSGTFAENEFGRKTKAIVDSDVYRAMFPKIHLSSDSRAGGYWTIAQFGGSYLTRGVGQGISGFRSNLAGVDDPFASREDAESQTIRNKVWDWFSADFSTRLLPNSPMFVVATRWHSDDLIGRIEEMNKSGLGLPWYIINLPAICIADDDAMGRELGEALWKDFFTLDHLMNLKATLPSRDWNSLYMGQPVDAEGGIISASWLQRYEQLPSKSKWKRVTLSVDSAIKDNQRADYTVIGVWIEMDDGSHYLAHVDRDKMELPAMIKRIETIAKEWDVGAILIEDKGSGTQYKQLRSGKAPAPVIALSTNNDSKEFRLDGVAPLFEAGKVFIPEKGIWVPDYEVELIGFPTAKYDDQVDMTSQYLQWARKKVARGSKPLHVASSAATSNNKVVREIQSHIEAIMERNRDNPLNKLIAASSGQ